MKIANNLADLLVLEKSAPGEYLSCFHEANTNNVLFGGQLFAQSALAAIMESPADRQISSFQITFARPAKLDRPVRYRVDNLGDQRNFSTRRVLAEQDGRAVTSANIMLQRQPAASMFEHEPSRIDVPPPEELPDADVLLRQQGKPFEHHMAALLAAEGLAQVRLVDPESYLHQRKPNANLAFWLRPRSPLPDGVNAQAAVAYMSDVWVVYAAVLPHITFNNIGVIRIGTVNQALWFFRPWQPNDWILVNAHSPAFGSSRGLGKAVLSDRNGRMIAMSLCEAVYSEAVAGVRKGA